MALYSEKETAAVEVSGLTKVIEDETVLENVSFSFAKKGIHGILSPKGGGKTALLDILACTSGYDEGRLTVNGTDIAFNGADSKNAREVKKNIGYVRQRSEFYSEMTPIEILNFVGSARKEEPDKLARQIKEALELVGLEEVSNRIVSRLGYVEQKMLGYAAAIVGTPDILIIDEPKSKATAEKNEVITGIIRLFGKRKTVILATEDYKTARALCDDVVIISDGRVLASGSFEELEDKLSRGDDSNGMTLESLYMSLLKASESGKNKGIR